MVNLNHGVARYSDLLRIGLSRAKVDALRSVGRLRRLRRGWYADSTARPDVVRAVRAGGTLSCLSALRHNGVWVPPDARLHIRMSEHHQARRSLPGSVHICPLPIRKAPTEAVDSLPTAIRAALRCLNEEGIVVILDSILNRRLLRRDQLADILSSAPARVRRLLAETDEQAQSGTESMARFRLRRLGMKVQSQVFVEGVGRVDLLVGERLVLELDSREHHSGAVAYTTDRRRDLVLVTGDKLVLRLTYEQTVDTWPDTLMHLRKLTRARSHRARRTRASPGVRQKPSGIPARDSPMGTS